MTTSIYNILGGFVAEQLEKFIQIAVLIVFSFFLTQ
jgi:hypothetical protein